MRPPDRRIAAVQYKGAVYRLAGVKDLAKIAASHLFRWMYDSGLSKERLFGWLRRLNPLSFLSKFRRNRRRNYASIVPEEILAQIAELFSKSGIPWGDFLTELTMAMDEPPKPYVWVIKNGEHVLVKKGEERTQTPVRGKRFDGQVLIGVWWKTPNAKGKPSKQLRSWIIKKDGASVFYNRADRKAKTREYGAFVVVPRSSVETEAIYLKDFGNQITEDGGEFQLSAVKLDPLAEGKRLKNSDRHFTHSVKSVRFNPQYTLVEVVNGEAPEYGEILSPLRAAVS